MSRKSGPERVIRPAKRKSHGAPGPARDVAPLGWRPAAIHATRLGLLFADVGGAALCAAWLLSGTSAFESFLPAVAAWLVLRMIAGLYNPVELDTPEEMRRGLLTTLVG